MSAIAPAEITLIRDSWARVVPIADQAAEIFYAKLFEAQPQLKALFANSDMPEQRQKLVKALATVVVSLDNFGMLSSTLKMMGQRHVGYGVQEDDYNAVGRALMATLQAGLGEHFTPATAAAWRKGYQLISETMISGAAQSDAA